MKAKYGVGDIVAVNDFYRQEGRKYFGKSLQHANFEGKILRVIENTNDERDGQGNVWENVYTFKNDIQFCERFLTLVSKSAQPSSVPNVSKHIDLNGKRINIKALCDYISEYKPRGSLLTANSNTDYYMFHVDGKNIQCKQNRINENTGARECADNVYGSVQEAIKGLIADVKLSGAVLDNIDGIIGDVVKTKGKQITAKYAFLEEYTPPRCRNSRTREVEGTVDVFIREVTGADAPIAFITTTYKYYFGEGGWRETIYRWYNNKLYTPHVRCFGADQREPCTIEDVAHEIAERANSYTAEKESDKIKKVKEKASRYLIIDDTLYVVSGEPRYNYTTFGMGNNHGGTGFFVDAQYNSNLSKESYFNALQRKEAIAEFKRVALARGDTNSVKEEPKENIQVLLPEAVKLKPTKVRAIQDTKTQWSAFKRILNQQNKLIALVLFDGTKMVEHTLPMCIKLAEKGCIKNVKVIHREGIKPYLQGNGISLETLPYRIV